MNMYLTADQTRRYAEFQEFAAAHVELDVGISQHRWMRPEGLADAGFEERHAPSECKPRPWTMQMQRWPLWRLLSRKRRTPAPAATVPAA